MLETMRNSQIFQNEYLFVRNAPYESLDRALFISRQYARKYQNYTLDLIPVTETALYNNNVEFIFIMEFLFRSI